MKALGDELCTAQELSAQQREHFRQLRHRDQEDVFANHLSDEGLKSRMYKDPK